MSLHGKFKQNFIKALQFGDLGFALETAQRGQGKDSTTAPDLQRTFFNWNPGQVEKNSTSPPEQAFSQISFNLVEPNFARVKINIGKNAETVHELSECFEKEVRELASRCEKLKIYTVLFEYNSSKSLAPHLAKKLNFLLERGIEHEFFSKPSDFKAALQAVALTDCSGFSTLKFFSVRQRVERYLKDIYIVETKSDYDFDKAPSIRGSVKEELLSIAKKLSGKQVIFMIDTPDLTNNVVKEIRRTLERNGTDCFFYFAGEINAGLVAESWPGKYYDSYELAIRDAQRKVGLPRVQPPRNGWSGINNPEYKREGNYFYIPGFRDGILPGYEELRSDMKWLAESASSIFCLDTGEKPLSSRHLIDINHYLNIPCEERGGMLIIRNTDTYQIESLRRTNNMAVVPTLELAHDRIEHFVRVSSPKGGFKHIVRPLRIEPDSDILYSQLSPTVVAGNYYNGPAKELSLEISRILEFDNKGLILDVGNTRINIEVFKDVGRTICHYYDRDFVIISKDTANFAELRKVGSDHSIHVHSTREAAILEMSYDIWPPAEGWNLFNPRAVNREFPVLVIEVTRGKIGQEFYMGKVPAAFPAELKHIAQKRLPVVLDLTSYGSTLSHQTSKALLNMQNYILSKNGKFSVVYYDTTAMSILGIKSCYSSLPSALIDITDFQRVPLGL